jgi:hypothetical protein
MPMIWWKAVAKTQSLTQAGRLSLLQRCGAIMTKTTSRRITTTKRRRMNYVLSSAGLYLVDDWDENLAEMVNNLVGWQEN